MVSCETYDRTRAQGQVSPLLRAERPHDRPLVAAGPRQRPDAPLHERGHGPVQGGLPRRGAAGLRARHVEPEVRPCRRQAQRSRERRAHRPPPHVLRDAGQLLVRRLLQARGDRLRVGVSDARPRAAEGPPLRDCVHRRRRGLRALEELRAPGPHPAARREGQLLGDGRHRALRALLGGPLPPGRPHPVRGGGSRAPVPRPRLRVRPLARDLEPRLHAVRPGCIGEAHAAPEALHRHRHGARADCRGRAGQVVELRHRSATPADRGRRAAVRQDLRGPRGGRRLDAGHRRPRARDGVSDRRPGLALGSCAGPCGTAASSGSRSRSSGR